MQERLIASLRNPAVYPGPVARVEVLETHISYVLLTGPYAYKIRKAVNLEFLDFTSLAARRFDCDEELRLNQPLAPSIYLDVVPITGSIERPVIGGEGSMDGVLEWAVKMRQFPQEALLSHRLSQNLVTPAEIDELAARVASFHASTARASLDSGFGGVDSILGMARQNFSQIRPQLIAADACAGLDAIAGWTEREAARKRPDFERRRREGFVRECHGDLHLGNIALIDGQVTLFDRLEFNAAMRWTDVMADVAFLVMDLQHRGRPDLASRVLSAYLERTGDYEGLAVLRFYLVYRAMVRAKVARFRAGQAESAAARQAAEADCREHLRLAARDAREPRPALVITHGLSGSGKTTLSQAVVEALGAVRIRTDIERKRLHGLAADATSHSAIEAGLYTPDATRRTYEHARDLARGIAAAGYVAIVDGAFLKRWQRDLFRALAADVAMPFAVVDVHARESTLRERIARRLARKRDASEATLATLDHQLATEEPLGPDEQTWTMRHDAETPPDRRNDGVTAGNPSAAATSGAAGGAKRPPAAAWDSALRLRERLALESER
jgi:aminoglycoside phosphotransferase family enzyme/predicted kinase